MGKTAHATRGAAAKEAAEKAAKTKAGRAQKPKPQKPRAQKTAEPAHVVVEVEQEVETPLPTVGKKGGVAAWRTNIDATLNMLECARALPSARSR